MRIFDDDTVIEQINDDAGVGQYVMELERVHIVKEFLSKSRTMPLVIFQVEENDSVKMDIQKAAKDLRINPDNIEAIEIEVIRDLVWKHPFQRLQDSPKTIIEIGYNSHGRDDNDEIILLATLLAKTTGKHVIVHCRCIDQLSFIRKGNLWEMTYDSRVERSFDYWNKSPHKAHMFVADDWNDTFAKHQEIYLTRNSEERVAKILDRVADKDKIWMKNLLGKVKNNDIYRALEPVSEGKSYYHLINSVLTEGVVDQLKKHGYQDVISQMQYEVVLKEDGRMMLQD